MQGHGTNFLCNTCAFQTGGRSNTCGCFHIMSSILPSVAVTVVPYQGAPAALQTFNQPSPKGRCHIWLSESDCVWYCTCEVNSLLARATFSMSSWTFSVYSLVRLLYFTDCCRKSRIFCLLSGDVKEGLPALHFRLNPFLITAQLYLHLSC